MFSLGELNNMAKVVHWGKYYPPDMGGIESVTSSVARGAQAAGHSVSVVCFRKGEAPDGSASDGVRILRAPIQMLKASQPMGFQYFRWLLEEGRKADIIHLHAPNLLASLATKMLGRGPRLVLHWHSDIVDKGLIGKLVKPLEAAMLKRADRIVCTSEAYAKASLPLMPYAHKISVVPIGVADVAPPSGEDRIPDVLARRIRGRRIILAIGRLVPYKGFPVLVDAAPHLKDDAVVVIVGTGPRKAELEAQINQGGLSDKVLLAGRQEDSALRALFRQAALFCLPSVERSEAFGVVLIEAMSHGLPIVATRIPGSGVSWVNAHGESGINVPVADPKALADACNELLASDALREKLARGARLRFETEFTEQVSTERMMKVYSTLLAGS